MSRRLALGLVTLVVLLALPPAAGAHPLGNFSINHLTRISVSERQVNLRYILDQAEIPTFQERRLSTAAVLARKRDEVARHLRLTVDGRTVALRFLAGAAITHPPGQGGLKLTRVELPLAAAVRDPRRVTLTDGTFAGRIGWKAVVAQPGRDTATRSSAPSGDPTNGLRTYPKDTLSSPLDERTATLSVAPGDGTLAAPRAAGGTPVTTQNRSGDGFTGVFSDAAAGQGVLLLLLLAAFGWGALHALSPGHGKAMVAAYLIGTRGTVRHAVALGGVVTITHTIGVFALGLVTLALSQYIVPEQLYPWLTLASGLLIVVIGAGVLRSRLRWYRARRGESGYDHAHVHDHDHAHAHGHDHHHHDHDHAHRHDHHHHDHAHGHDHHHHDDDHAHGHDHHHHDDDHAHGHDHHHGHGHSHHVPDQITWRGLVGMGASAGLIPCPSALVVLLGAIAQHQVALGLLLIVLFSTGLAVTLIALGLSVIYAKRMTARVSFGTPIAAALSALSAVVIVGVGLALTLRAIPQLG